RGPVRRRPVQRRRPAAPRRDGRCARLDVRGPRARAEGAMSKRNDVRIVTTRCERWDLRAYRDPKTSERDEVVLEVERDGHNGLATLTAREAASVVDALIDLLPDLVQHSERLRRKS